MHPQIADIIEITRKKFPVGNIFVVTNGILLGDMTKDFWEVCRENNIIVAVTKYPINLDYDRIEKLVKSYGIQYVEFGNHNQGTWTKINLELLGNRKELNSFLACGNANNCPILMSGKLFPCPRVAKIIHFNKHFNKSLPVTELDYINIYEMESLDQIMTFLSRPIPFCRYCNPYKSNYLEWGISKKEIDEWKV